MSLNRHSLYALATLVLCLGNQPLLAENRTAADILPETVAVYAELANSDSILQHPLREKLLKSQVVKEILRTPDLLKLRGGITIAELALGNTLEIIAGKLSARGLVLAVDAESSGAILLAHGENQQSSAEFVEKLVALARKDEGRDKTIQLMRELEYRGYHVYERDKIAFAAIDDWLFVTNKGQLGKLAVDRYLDRKTGSLAENDSFKQALAARQAQHPAPSKQTELLWVWANLPVLREKGVTNKLSKEFAKNPIAELILGGVLDSVVKSPYVSGTVLASHQSLQLRIATPHKSEWVSSSREFFFGPRGMGRAKPLIELNDSLLSVSLYRNVSAMWVRAGDLFSEEVNEKLAQADSSLTTLFSGRDFGEDILGAIKPELRIVVKRQTFALRSPRPSIKLPSFALIAELREPEIMQRELKRIFQSLIGFLNVAGANNGQPQLDLDFEKTQSGALVMATYAAEVDRLKDEEAPIQFNFSPCLAFEGKFAVVSSSVELAREATEHLRTEGIRTESTIESQHNTEIRLNADVARSVLDANRRQLVAQNMLEKGHSKEQAETEINTLLQLLELLQNVHLTLDAGEELAVNVGLELK